MDVGAYILKDLLVNLLPSEPPRLRGIRLMKLEEPNSGLSIFDSHCGKDLIYIHTRCGQCNFDCDDNYKHFGMDKWEKELGDLFLEANNDDFDCTYRDTYIKVPEGKEKEYKEALDEVKEIYDSAGED